jgi:hypothetical protein
VPERINKLQPDRTVALRGFDTFAAAASVHNASPAGFTVSGTFRDPADFAVVVLYDADDYYEHPLIKYLPDFNFNGLTLSFDLDYTDGLQPIDSPKYNWIDWATLDLILADGTTAQVNLWDNATLVGGSFPAASAVVNVETTGTIQPYDRITLWFQNLAFDYIVPGGSASVDFSFYAGGTGTVHTITVADRTWTYVETAGLTGQGQSSNDVAVGMAGAVGDPYVVATASGNTVSLTVQLSAAGIEFTVSASDGNGSAAMLLMTPLLVAEQIVSQVNSTNWISANTTHGLMASNSGAAIALTAARYGKVNVANTVVTWVSGTMFPGILPGAAIFLGSSAYTVASVQSPTQLTLTATAGTESGVQYVAPRGGRDGNLLQLYTLAKTSTLTFDQAQFQLSGGSSAVAWNCTIDFTALNVSQIRQAWLTFAPSLTLAPYTATEWQAVFSNWTVSGPAATQALSVAGPGSVRLEEDDQACVYTGTWNQEAGFYSKYFAVATSDTSNGGASVTVTYTCQFTHNLYIGTSLYIDRGIAGIRLDGDTETQLNCYLNTSSAVVTRRVVRSVVAPGTHTVVIRLAAAGIFYFDFLEAAVLSDVPDAITPRTGISPALDVDTDHTYKLSPARLMWIFDKLGYAGPMNEYLGVFWWNERTLSGGSVSTAQIAFSGTFAGGDTIVLTLNGSALGKSVFPADTLSTIANHFAAYINSAFVNAYASASGGVLTITGRSPASAYTLAVSLAVTSTAGVAAVTRQPVAGVYGNWIVNDNVSALPNGPINRATRDWHADFYAQCASRSRAVVTSCSMELVNPPAHYAALFPDSARTPVSTATGFGSLLSTQCAVGGTQFVAYQKAVYRAIAAMQVAAGLTPSLQYGEFLWWYFSGPSGGMGYYDDETMAAAQTALGRPLHVFQTPNDDPTVNGSADATFLRNRLRDHVAALMADIRSVYPAAQCEVLFPYDVNYPTPVPTVSPTEGGQLNNFVNLPVEWKNQATSGLTTMKVEALAFASSMRNLDLAREAIELFPGFGWPLGALRYLVPVFGSATPWHRELALAVGAGINTNNLWALDHVCLYNLAVPEPSLERRSTKVS